MNNILRILSVFQMVKKFMKSFRNIIDVYKVWPTKEKFHSFSMKTCPKYTKQYKDSISWINLSKMMTNRNK